MKPLFPSPNVDAMAKLAKAHQIEDQFSTSDALDRFLKWWWCQTYNRPLKDPLLETYTTDELIYEFFRHFYSKPENNPLREIQAQKSHDDDAAWIAAQMAKAKEKAVETVAQIEKPAEELPPPTQPEDISTKFE